MKLVLVEWVDSHSGKGWQPLDEIAEVTDAVRCRSVGWLVADTGECKVIVPHISGESNEGVRPCGTGGIAIPKRNIVSTTVLRQR